MEDKVYSFDSIGIQECQRNRYPLLFIDKVVEAIPGKSAHVVKNFTYNEWYFPAHFDDEPNVPGFIQTEILAQSFLMTFLSIEEYRGKKTAFVSQDDVHFRRKLIPGDTLDIFATLDRFRRGVATGHVESFVGDESACSARFKICIPDIIDQFRPKE